MIIEIQYKDKSDWQSVSGKQISWANYSKKYKEERIQPYYVAPFIVTDVWDGKESDIQHVRWTSYYFQLLIKESEIEFINQLKSCSNINIIQYQENDSGLIINNSFENIDLIKSEYLSISEPERVGQTTGWKVDIVFRVDRTVINKALPIDNTNNIRFQNNQWKNDFVSAIFDRVTNLSSTRVCTSSFGLLQTYDIINDSYVSVGNSLDTSFDADISALDSTSIALVNDANQLSKYSFDGTDWSLTGNTFALAGVISPRITSLSSSRVAIYDDGTDTIRAYDFDGTNWSLVGSALSITAGVADIAAMTSSKIALLDPTSKELRDYNFNGSTWSVNQTIVTTINGTVSIAKLESDRVAICSSTEKVLKSYKLDSSWSIESGSLSISVGGAVMSEIDTDKIFLSAGSNAGNYSYGIYDYYSDYDVLDWEKTTENTEISWHDGTIKYGQLISKTGKEYVHYILTENHDTFINDLKKAKETSVNGTIISEVSFEKLLIAEGLYKIIVRGVSDVTVNTNYFNDNQTYNITIDGTPYYTDYLPQLISESPDINTTENQTGINTSTKSITKQVKQYKFYLNESDAFLLKAAFESRATTKTADGSNVLEEREVSPEKIGLDSNLYEVVVNCLLSTTDT
jgi:hypothetical protein